MGRKAGHLALGIGKAAGATLTPHPRGVLGRRIRLKTVVDTLAGAIIKRLSYGRRDGVAIIAEGLVLEHRPARTWPSSTRWSATRTATCASTRSTSARS